MNAAGAGGLAGVLGWLLFFVAVAVDPTPPTLGASAADVLDHVAGHRRAMLAAAFLFGCGSSLFMVWGAALAKLMRDREGDGGWLWLVVLGANCACWALNLVASFLLLAMASRGFRAGGTLAELQIDLFNYAAIFTGFGSAVLVPAASLVMARTGLLSKRLGQIGFAVTALQLLFVLTAWFSSGPMTGGGPVTIAGFTTLGLWLLATSIAMLVAARRHSS